MCPWKSGCTAVFERQRLGGMEMFSSKLYRIGVNGSFTISIRFLQLKILLKRISFIVLKLLTIFRRGKFIC